MDDVDSNVNLALEMAAISAVKSEEIVGLAKEASDLNRIQNILDESKDRVQTVKAVLSTTAPHEVTPELARAMDNQLDRAVDVVIPPTDGMEAVLGAEHLGYTLLPQDYLLTRLAGCENFLNDFFKKSKEVLARMGASAKEAYILVTQTHDNLETALDALEKSLEASGNFDSNQTILLGSRLFNLFKINGKVSEDWPSDLSRLSRTISGISNNYYLSSKNQLNTLMSYFGGFADADAETGRDRYLRLPVVIDNNRFKECSYPNKDLTTGAVTAKQSVELMGGAFFVDVRLNNPARGQLSNDDAVGEYLTRHLDMEYVGFENNAPMIFPKLGNEVKALSSGQIKAVIKHLREVLKEWKKVFEGGEKFKMSESDFSDISKGIYESSMPEDLKDKALTAFSSLVRKNQMELLNLRVAVNSYLVLIVNGLVDLCHDSIKANVA